MRAAEQRAWEVVKRAYDERTPGSAPRRPSARVVAVLVAVVAGAIVAAVFSPPGRAVFHRMREAVGIEHAAPALFSLPAHGRLLVVSRAHGGVWLVHDNGLKRRLGSYDDAQWSPHGRFLVATRENELVTLDATGAVHWSLPQRGVHAPRWEGTTTDTRIAYLSDSGLRVVAGDGTDDRLLDSQAAKAVPPAWDPARQHALAYVARGVVVLRDADTGHTDWRAAVGVHPSSLEWSSDGRLLAVISDNRIVVLDAAGKAQRTVSMLGAKLLEGSFAPGSHRLAVAARLPSRSEVRMVDVDHPGRARLLFAGPGVFGDLTWSPDAKWLLVAWPTADQWLFLHGNHVNAVANIREQFPRADGRGPTLELAGRWCCS